jgi:HEPN domain-containing protein
MPEPDEILTVVGEWVEKADHDLTIGSHALKLGKKCPTDTVCFHAQQCVEKYLKAVLVLKQIPFPKTHDIEQIAALLPSVFLPALSEAEMDLLTDYAAPARYPGWRDISLAEARHAVTLARRVRRDVRKHLPKRALRTKRK